MQLHIPQMISNQVDLLPYEEFYKRYPIYLKNIRWQVFRTKGYTCVSCGLIGTHAVIWHENKRTQIHTDLVLFSEEHNNNMVMITLDHIIPKSKGGPKTLENLQPMCTVCNRVKAEHILTPEQVFAKRNEELERQKQRFLIREQTKHLKEQRDRHWTLYKSGSLPCSEPCTLCFPV